MWKGSNILGICCSGVGSELCCCPRHLHLAHAGVPGSSLLYYVLPTQQPANAAGRQLAMTQGLGSCNPYVKTCFPALALSEFRLLHTLEGSEAVDENRNRKGKEKEKRYGKGRISWMPMVIMYWAFTMALCSGFSSTIPSILIKCLMIQGCFRKRVFH